AAAFFHTVDATDVRVIGIKSALSGYLVAVTCYHLGTGPKRSGADVGEAVNAAIVVGMGLLLAVHASLTFTVYSCFPPYHGGLKAPPAGCRCRRREGPRKAHLRAPRRGALAEERGAGGGHHRCALRAGQVRRPLRADDRRRRSHHRVGPRQAGR